jgi:pectin methylesterase-like acyl-CoA thioesterase
MEIMRYTILVLAWGLLPAATALADVYVINPEGTGDFPTIQDAVNAVEDGDVIALTDGVFAGVGNWNVDYRGKAITVMSQSGNPEDCVIDLADSGTGTQRGFHFHSGEGPTSVLQGLSIKNGHAFDP